MIVCNYKVRFVPLTFCRKHQVVAEMMLYQVNDPMEVHDNNNIVQDYGTNQMIQDLFDHQDEDHGDSSDGIYDEPMIEKENK
jgi:hypothetical protein